MKKLEDIVIKIDTREQQPWKFDEEQKKPGQIRIAGSIVECIDAADYSIVGMEDFIRIERKMGFRELVGNMTPIDSKERFHREMEKLKDIKYKYLIIESNLSKDVMSLAVPQFKSNMPMFKIFEWTIELQQEYGIIPIFAGDAGQRIAKTILRKAAKEYYDNSK